MVLNGWVDLIVLLLTIIISENYVRFFEGFVRGGWSVGLVGGTA